MKRAFTLIELLISTTIILLLIVATIPGYDKVRDNNQLTGSALKVQDCVSRAKYLSLAPDSIDVQFYEAVLTQPNICIVNMVLKDSTSSLVETFRLSQSIQYSTLRSGINIVTTHTFRFIILGNGAAQEPDGAIGTFYIYNSKYQCQKMTFIPITGEILVEDSGTINAQGLCL